MLTAEERANKFVKTNAPILDELKTVSALVHEVVAERSSPGTWTISYRDGVKMTIDSASENIFRKLKGNPKIRASS